LALCAGGVRAEAQEVASTFDQLAVLVRPGDKISVIDVNGTETRGRIGKLSEDVLISDGPAGPRQLGEAEVATISQRRSDRAGIDALISRRQVIYQKARGPSRVGFSPLVGIGRWGAVVIVTF
jgi:hypothetical protein